MMKTVIGWGNRSTLEGSAGSVAALGTIVIQLP